MHTAFNTTKEPKLPLLPDPCTYPYPHPIRRTSSVSDQVKVPVTKNNIKIIIIAENIQLRKVINYKDRKQNPWSYSNPKSELHQIYKQSINVDIWSKGDHQVKETLLKKIKVALVNFQISP